jgi:hypothetical protein
VKLLAHNIQTEFTVILTGYFLTQFHNSSVNVPLRITVTLKHKLKFYNVYILFVSIVDKVV